MRVLVTGGAGYIGSHLAVVLGQAGASVVALDDLSRGRAEAVERAARLAGAAVQLVVADAGDEVMLASVLRAQNIEAIVHLAAAKSVEESVADPAGYERQNVGVTGAVARAAQAAGVRMLVFASTAAVYGDPVLVPTPEAAPLAPLSPYADTKARAESLLEAGFGASGAVANLRFFNVVGAHPSAELGEYVDTPTNLLPIVLQRVLAGRPTATVFGGDWPTADGSCVRDYVHVMDVASGIAAALARLGASPGARAYNLGTGAGASVLEVIAAVQRACGEPVVAQIGPRRGGDPAVSIADVARAKRELGWSACYVLDEMAAHAWAWTRRRGT